ncbi:glycosyltransferase [Empedobacter falsenii]|uniref:glycosyltransferase n=1 Tax=Empedobacter falsenii TaxID=343874 RepID=UPI0025752E86|nr:glycosyltransferase [Empedobacter falsenii]MDM1547545.1 glycosyltransferase [Empedobacter falsenii]
MKNKLAIVIPFYKVDFFEKTIQSIVEQTDKRYTLYIGNDASPNNPKPILDKYLQPQEYHYFNYKENLGGKNLALQWERILEKVTEEWVQILGDDDCIGIDFVETFYKTLPQVEKENISLIKCGIHWINDEGELLETHVYDFDIISATEVFIKKYLGEIRSSLSENIYKTQIIKNIKFTKLPLAWGTDDLSLLDFSQKGLIKYISKHLVNVRISTESISGSILYDQKKSRAINTLREIIIMKHSNQLPDYFIRKTMEDYLYEAYYKGFSINTKVLLFYLKKLEIINFLKTAKKIYYIRKKHLS